MKKSTLSEHIIERDIIKTPANAAFGEMLSSNPWCKYSLPEYIWIALIFIKYGREKGFSIFSELLYELEGKEICIAEMSKIMKLSPEQQEEFFNAIDKNVVDNVFSPLTVIYREKEYDYFYNRYSLLDVTLEENISALIYAIGELISQESRLGIDVRFIVIQFGRAKGKIFFAGGMDPMTFDAITNYPNTDTNDSRLSIYDAFIRSTTNAITSINKDETFVDSFWETISTITPCNPLVMQYDLNREEGKKMQDFLEDSKKALSYIQATIGEKAINIKYIVILGIVTYAVKIYSEIVDGNLHDKASGRILYRTILEAYINLKYLLLKENENENVYEAFQEYGLGKFKLVMKKNKEHKYPNEEPSHYNIDAMELFVNELGNEEFLNIGIGYFDRTSIKNRFKEVDEDALYELYYEFDTSYAHSFWGAIRESAMLICDNPAHLYHSVPDYNFNQNLPSIYPDCNRIIIEMFKVISDEIELPVGFCEKYEV